VWDSKLAYKIALLGDDGKGNVKTAILVGDGQKFWFKGYVTDQYGSALPNVRVDIWFDEYSPDPPYTYRKSWWLSTQYTNTQGYFDQSPYDVEWLKLMGYDLQGFPILQLWQAKLGKIWEGKVAVNLGFKGTVT